jgi:hypothetical protein
MSTASLTLSQLVAGPYLLAYSIPLLIISVPVTFAGAFFTLDRTRSFAGTGAAAAKWRLEGGLGGIAGGWLFGVHLTTFLTLAICNLTSAAPTGQVVFLVIWLLTGTAIAILAGRFKVASLLFLGLQGGTALSLLFIVIFTPALLARTILTVVFAVLLPVCCLIPVPALQHGALRFSSALIGSFGVIVAGALLGGVPSWADIWTRLWVEKSEQWGNGQEKGLSAAMSLLCVLGVICDWFLKRKFGENPDQKWDEYLASYAANLPNASDRAGTFEPVTSFWSRVLHPKPKNPVADPFDPKAPLNPVTKLKSRKASGNSTTLSPVSGRKLRTADKDAFLSGSSSSSSDSDEASKRIPRPWAVKRSSSAALSGTTAHSDTSSRGRGKKKRSSRGGVHEDYSDGESVRDVLQGRRTSREGTGWKPGFFARHNSTAAGDLEKGFVPLSRKTSSGGHDRTNAGSPPPAPPPGSVPVTPSLINALDRVALAQTQAYAPQPEQAPNKGSNFWAEVEDKAAKGSRSGPAFPKPRTAEGMASK